MDTFVQAVYLTEIQTQCCFALHAVRGINQAMALCEADASHHHTLHLEVFRQMHSFLTHSSNVSKLLWPVASASQERGSALRTLLGVPEASCLKDRTLRNHLDHYDERLDAWRKQDQRLIISDCNIGPKDMIEGVDDTGAMRNYDPAKKIFSFRGEDYDIQELTHAARDLFSATTDKLRSLRPPALV